MKNFAMIAPAHLIADDDAVRGCSADGRDLAGSQPKDVLPFVAVAHDEIGDRSRAIRRRRSKLSVFARHRISYDGFSNRRFFKPSNRPDLARRLTKVCGSTLVAG